MGKTLKISILTLCLFLYLAGSAFAQKTIELNVWMRTTAVLGAFNEFNDRMEKEGRNLRVNVNVVQLDTFTPAFSAALAAGEPIDLVSIDLVMVPFYSSKGAFHDITTKVEALPYKQHLNKAMLDLGKKDGRIFAVPNAADVSALLYNKKLFKEAGIAAPPKNWAEFEDIARKLTRKGRYGYAFSGADAGGLMFTVMPWAWANGGQWLSADGTKANLAHPKTVETMEWISGMIAEGVVPKGVVAYKWSDYQQAFAQERVGMVGGGNFWVDMFNQQGIDFGVVPFFDKNGTSKSAFVGGDLLGIPITSKHPDLAWEVIQFLLSKDVQVEVYAKAGRIPVRNDFVDNPYFNAEPKYKAFAEAARSGYVPYTTKYNELYNPYLVAMQKAMRDKQNVAKSLKQGSEKMQRILDRP